MKPKPLTLCTYCAGCVRSFAATHPHADIPAMRRARWNGCCRYWLARGVPDGWWV